MTSWRSAVTCAAVLAAAPSAWSQPYAYVSGAAAGAVGVLDLGSQTLVGSFPVSGLPAAAALSRDGRRLYVVRSQLDSLAAIDTATGATSEIRVGAAPAAVAVVPRDRHVNAANALVYVANAGDDTVSVVDPAASAVVATIPVGAAPVALAFGGTRVYAANWNDGTVSVIDRASGKVVGTVAVGNLPAGLAAYAPTGRLYVANFFDDTVSVVDTATLSVVATVPVGRRPRALALDRLGRRLYVAGFEDGRIHVIDTTTNAVVLQGASGAENPMDLLLGPGDERLYVAHLQTGQSIGLLDAATLAPRGAVDAPAGPVALAGLGTQAPPVGAEAPHHAPAEVLDAPRGLDRPVGLPHATRARRPASPTDVTISDTEFEPADWHLFQTAGGVGVSQQPGGGNPGAWRHTFHIPGPIAVESFHRYSAASYDPAVQGPIAAIDSSWDRRTLAASIAEGAPVVEERLLLLQGALRYRTAADTFASLPWERTIRIGLTAADFDDGNGGHPDFTATGEPIHFGYYCRTPPGVEAGHGIDNFRLNLRTGGSGGPGLFGFGATAATAIEDVPVTVSVERTGGTTGTVGVTVLIETPGGSASSETLSWPDGDGSPRSLGAAFELPSGAAGVRTARLRLVSPTGGASVSPSLDTMVVAIVPADWPPGLLPLVQFFQVLLAGFTPLWLLALAVPAVFAGLSRRRRARRLAGGLGLLAVSAPLSGCVPQVPWTFHSGEMIWNDRIRLDGLPLVEDSSACVDAGLACRQRSTDPWVGHYETRDDHVISEIFPELGSDFLTRRLPKSDCLFVPHGQAMRASWEAVFGLDPNLGLGRLVASGGADMPADADDRYGRDFYPGGLLWFSASRFNTPYDRADMTFDFSLACEIVLDDCPECVPGPYWAAFDYPTILSDCDTPPTPLSRIFEGQRQSVFDTDLRASRYTDPRPGRNLCAPAVSPDPADESVSGWIADCPVSGGMLDATAARCVFQPDRDATLSVRSAGYDRSRVLSPALMVVKRDEPRRLLRTMRPPANGTTYRWSTPPSAVRNDAGGPQPEEPNLRWEENFTPDVRVAEVRVKRVDASGAEHPLAPVSFRVLDPESATGTATLWECPGETEADGGKVYRLASSTACRRDDGGLQPLPVTPTYLVANLTNPAAPPLVAPLLWEATLPPGLTADEVAIEFTLQNVACAAGTTCNALKASEAEKDLGGLQVQQPHRTVVEITNVGPEPLRVASVAMEAVAGYADARGDFTIDLLSDPQAVPIPVERTPDGRFRLGADFDASPLVVSTTTTAGEPAYTRPLAADGARVVVGGAAIEAAGNPRFESHRLTYDDPGADFSWTPTEAGVTRPFAEVAYLRRLLPFYLDPGHSFWVRLTVAPRAQGNRRAHLGVSATADSDPAAAVSVRTLMKHRGLSGPTLAFAPAVLTLPREHLDAAGQPVALYALNAFVSNYGGVDMQRTAIAITGPDAGRFRVTSTHAPARTIPPGRDERFTIAYTPSCAVPQSPPPAHGPRQFEATLRITTNGGEGVAALRGEWCPQLQLP